MIKLLTEIGPGSHGIPQCSSKILRLPSAAHFLRRRFSSLSRFSPAASFSRSCSIFFILWAGVAEKHEEALWTLLSAL